MSLKYINNLLILVAGAFLVVASRTFAPDTAGWLGLGVGALAVVLAGAGIAVARLTPAARADRRDPVAAAAPAEASTASIGFGLTALIGAWTIVASVVFSGATQGWLVFADALALAGVALVQLSVHEVTTERVVHTLVVSREQELQAV